VHLGGYEGGYFGDIFRPRAPRCNAKSFHFVRFRSSGWDGIFFRADYQISNPTSRAKNAREMGHP
jgi:hypothetical protein